MSRLFSISSSIRPVILQPEQSGSYPITKTNNASDFIEQTPGQWSTSSPDSNICIAISPVVVNKSGYHEAEYNIAKNQLSVVALDTYPNFNGDGTHLFYTGGTTQTTPDDFDFFMYIDTDGNYAVSGVNYGEGTLATINVAAQFGDKFRISRVNLNVKGEYFRNGVWNHIYTFNRQYAGPLYIKAGAYHITTGNSILSNPHTAIQL